MEPNEENKCCSSELQERIQDFLQSFELVLDQDWDYTKMSLKSEYLIGENGTFLDPFPGEHFTGGKGDNWANRSSLLSAYRELRAFAISENIYVPYDPNAMDDNDDNESEPN
jgi:hypothetical protein